MKILIQLVLGTLLGVSVLNAFTTLISDPYGRTFNMPIIKKYSLRLSSFKLSGNDKVIIVWYLLYAISLVFVLSYDFIFNVGTPFSWSTALLFGGVSGLVAIIGWMIIFGMPFKRPKALVISYFVMLFISHLLFAVGVVRAYKHIALV